MQNRIDEVRTERDDPAGSQGHSQTCARKHCSSRGHNLLNPQYGRMFRCVINEQTTESAHVRLEPCLKYPFGTKHLSSEYRELPCRHST